MKKALIFLFLSMMLIFMACHKNDCNETYTISGKMLNGTNMQPIIGGTVTLQCKIHNATLTQYTWTSKIDSNGNFSISYPCQNSGQLLMSVANYAVYIPPYNGNGDFPLDQNINQTWTAAQYGWLKIYLNPQSPLGGEDTLLVQLNYGTIKNYTILHTQTGILDSLYMFTLQPYSICWGIGSEDFFSYKHTLGGPVIGDPYITKVTINY